MRGRFHDFYAITVPPHVRAQIQEIKNKLFFEFPVPVSSTFVEFSKGFKNTYIVTSGGVASTSYKMKYVEKAGLIYKDLLQSAYKDRPEHWDQILDMFSLPASGTLVVDNDPIVVKAARGAGLLTLEVQSWHP